MGKPLLVLDFDGVIHSYKSGWAGATVIPDSPVPGAIEFIEQALSYFRVAIYSSRSGEAGGIEAMQRYIEEHDSSDQYNLVEEIEWPTSKPPAFITIDDRVFHFQGAWPDLPSLLEFKPWNKRAGYDAAS
jgi:hypothetical protein